MFRIATYLFFLVDAFSFMLMKNHVIIGFPFPTPTKVEIY
jgi:hypothetical protein